MNPTRFAAAAVLLALSACATGPNTNYMDNDGYSIRIDVNGREHNPDIVRVVRQEQFRNMLLVKREAGSEANQHPFTIEAEALAGLLQKIKVRHNKDAPKFLFDKERGAELRQFSQWLSEALALAGPGEEVLFHFPQERGFGFLSEPLMTTGRVFVKDQQLNLIFGDIQMPYQGQWMRAGNLRHFKPASRAASNLESDEMVVDAKSGRVNRKDWVQLDTTLPDATGNTRMPGAVPQEPPASAEQRLQKLLQLKAKGLISDEEYQQKRQQILNQI